MRLLYIGMIRRAAVNFRIESKRYIREDGSEYVNQIVSDSDNALFTAEITLAEVAAVIAAKHRAPGGISNRLRENLLSKFLHESAELLFLIATERSTIEKSRL